MPRESHALIVTDDYRVYHCHAGNGEEICGACVEIGSIEPHHDDDPECYTAWHGHDTHEDDIGEYATVYAAALAIAAAAEKAYTTTIT